MCLLVAVLRRGSNGHCPPPPSLMICLPSCIILIFFEQALLPMYNAANDVDGWKRLEIIFEIMN